MKDVELNGEDCFMLLSQAIQMLRQEHLLKLDITRREIQKRFVLVFEILYHHDYAPIVLNE